MPNFSAERGVDEQGVKDDLYLASKEPISCDHCCGHGAFPPVFRPRVARATLYRSGVAIRVLERAAWWTARGTRDNIRLPDLESLIRRSGAKMGELKRLRRSVGAWRRIRLVAMTRQSQPGATGMGIKPLYAGTARTRHRPFGSLTRGLARHRGALTLGKYGRRARRFTAMPLTGLLVSAYKAASAEFGIGVPWFATARIRVLLALGLSWVVTS